MSRYNGSEGQRQELMQDVDALLKKWEMGFDDLLQAFANEMKDQAERQKLVGGFNNEAVVSCLESCSEGLSQASMDFYVSTKVR